MAQINDLDELLSLYGTASGGAVAKEQPSIGPEYQSLIEASPFFALATVGPDGLDCSPRGDAAGFVKVLDEHTIEVADRKGNNRLDSLRNIVVDPRVALLFLIPGRHETMRVNGRAIITTDEDRLAAHVQPGLGGGRPPVTVLQVTVETAYFQCGKATMRSYLWDQTGWPAVDHLPTAGQLSATFRDGVNAASYDNSLDRRLWDDITT